jgi:hypothetical protein
MEADADADALADADGDADTRRGDRDGVGRLVLEFEMLRVLETERDEPGALQKHTTDDGIKSPNEKTNFIAHLTTPQTRPKPYLEAEIATTPDENGLKLALALADCDSLEDKDSCTTALDALAEALIEDECDAEVDGDADVLREELRERDNVFD